MASTRPLTPKAQQFVREYLVDLDATNAARRAGYSTRTAKQTGCDLLRDPRVKAMVDAEMAARAKRTLITADANLRAIERLAQKAEVAGDWAPAIRARELIGKHYRSFIEKVELTGKGDGPIEFTEIRRTVVDPAAPKA